MKKKIWISLLFVVLAILAVVAVFYFTSTCVPLGEVKLCYEGTEVVLTSTEASLMRSIFSFKIYNGGIGGCPYEEAISISFGNTVYAIATDDCYTAKEWQSGRCFEFNPVEFEAIAAMFAKYFGDTPID